QEDDAGHGGPFPLDPSLVVESSPGKFHRYWLVADHWAADERGRMDFAGVMERLIESYGSDKNAKDISRVLRLPGFLHRKDPARPHMVHIIEAIRAERAEARRVERIAKLIEIADGNSKLPTDRHYPVVYADPPWQFRVYNENSSIASEYGAAGVHYPCMS